jgi:hypothetical protein
MTTTLTDRYVAAVVRGVPEKQRADLDKELRASIADAIDDRMEAGADQKTAEHDAIAELGDPIVLAAGYTERPLYLIGPALYPYWKRLVFVLELIVVPIVLVTIAIVWLFRGESVGNAIGASLWISFEVALQLMFWITVAFAIYERSASARQPVSVWTPDLLPDTSTEPTRNGTLIGAGFASVFITIFILSWFVSPFTDASGDPITFFDPWIVETGLVFVLVAVPLLQIGGGVLRLNGRWNLGVAIAAIAVDVIGAIAVIVLGATGHILNPAFIEAAGWPDLVEPIVNVTFVCLGVLTILTSAWENLRSVRRG